VRSKLKGVLPKELPENVAPETIQWTVGEDMPFSFDKETLYKEAKKTIYLNFKRGVITKYEKGKIISNLRKQHKITLLQ